MIWNGVSTSTLKTNQINRVHCRVSTKAMATAVFFSPCQDRALLPIDGDLRELCIVTRVGIWLLPLCLWRLLEVSWSKRVSIALVLSPTRQPSLVYPLMQVINHLLPSPHKLQIHQRSPILVEMERETNIIRIGVGEEVRWRLRRRKPLDAKEWKRYTSIYTQISNSNPQMFDLSKRAVLPKHCLVVVQAWG